MVLESDWHDDMDVARAVHSPHGNIHIGSPYLDPRYTQKELKNQMLNSNNLLQPVQPAGHDRHPPGIVARDKAAKALAGFAKVCLAALDILYFPGQFIDLCIL